MEVQGLSFYWNLWKGLLYLPEWQDEGDAA